jgi:hypothetical protein
MAVCAKVRWTGMCHVPAGMVPAHLRRVHHDLVGMMGCGRRGCCCGRVMLRQSMVGVLRLLLRVVVLVLTMLVLVFALLVEATGRGGRPKLVQRTAVLLLLRLLLLLLTVRIVSVRRVTLLARMRVLW